ncbi:MAG: hypothetical protein KAI50_03920 [Desulfobacterales bacterium]|nr:hypothetical protein [Desulfobacterales bacterium]
MKSGEKGRAYIWVSEGGRHYKPPVGHIITSVRWCSEECVIVINTKKPKAKKRKATRKT